MISFIDENPRFLNMNGGNSSFSSLHEAATSALVGKTKNILEIEKILNSCTDERGLLVNDAVAANISRIERLFAVEFNCEDVVISVGLTIGNVIGSYRGSVLSLFQRDASTAANVFANEKFFLKGLSTEAADYIEKSSVNGGYRFKTKEAGGTIFIGVNGSVLGLLTPGEFIAVILHEIGHNFYFGNMLSKLMGIVASLRDISLKYISSSITKVARLLLPDFIKKLINYIWKYVDTGLTIVNRIRTLNTFKAHLRYLLSPAGIPAQAYTAVHNTLFGAWENEKFADNFAAAYGFGPQLASGLVKLSTGVFDVDSSGKDPGALSAIDTLLSLPTTLLMIMCFGDCHPSIIARFNNTKKFIETEMRREKDPRIRKVMAESMKKFDVIFERQKYPLLVSYLNVPADLFKDFLSSVFMAADFRKNFDGIKGLRESTGGASILQESLLYSNLDSIPLQTLREDLENHIARAARISEQNS